MHFAEVQHYIYVFTSILMLIFVVISGYETILYAPKMMGEASTILHIPKGPFFYVVGVGWILLAFTTVVNILRALQKFVKTRTAAIIIALAFAISIYIIAAQPFSAMMKRWDAVTVGIIGMLFFFLLMFLKQPVSIAMGFAGFFILGLYIGWGPAFNITASVPFASLYNYTWSTVPMFVTMGYLAKNTGLAEDFYYGVRQWIGHLPGGLLHAVVVGNAAFGACSGDTLGAGVTFCSISLPETRKYHYDDTLTLGCIAGGSVLAALIPPSMLFIIYGATTQVSIGRLFIGGLLPGVLLTVMYMVLIAAIAIAKPNLSPSVKRVPAKEALKATPNMMYLVIVFAVIIGGIYMGVFSPTEAGAFGAATVAVIGLLRRKLTWKTLMLSLRESGSTLGMIGLLLAGSMVFQRLIVLTGITKALGQMLIGITDSPILFMLITAILLIILGCFIDALPLLMLMSPILYPIAVGLGINEIHFGVVCVTVILIGTLTPPVGIMVYALAGTVKEIPMMRIFKGVMPFVAVMVIFTVIIVLFPEISTVLVTKMFGA
jgi:tripartite ATP-independent transporter DctM subunit